MKRILSLFLTCILTFSLVSITVFADPHVGGDGGMTDIVGSTNANKAYETDGVRITVYDIKNGRKQLGHTIDYIHDRGDVNPMTIKNFSRPASSSTKLSYLSNPNQTICDSGLYIGSISNSTLFNVTDLPKIIGGFDCVVESTRIERIKEFFRDKYNVLQVMSLTGANVTQEELEENGQDYAIVLEPIGFFRFEGEDYAVTATEAAILNARMGSADPRFNYHGLPSFTHNTFPRAIYLTTHEDEVVSTAMSKIGLSAWNEIYDYPSLRAKLADSTIINYLGVTVVAFTGEEEEEETPLPQEETGLYICDTDAITTIKLYNKSDVSSHNANITVDFSFDDPSYNHTEVLSAYVPPQAIMDYWSSIPRNSLGGLLHSSYITKWCSTGSELEDCQTIWTKWRVPDKPMNVVITITSNNPNVVPNVSSITGPCYIPKEHTPPDPDPVNYKAEDFDGPGNFYVPNVDQYKKTNSQIVKSYWSTYVCQTDEEWFGWKTTETHYKYTSYPLIGVDDDGFGIYDYDNGTPVYDYYYFSRPRLESTVMHPYLKNDDGTPLEYHPYDMSISFAAAYPNALWSVQEYSCISTRQVVPECFTNDIMIEAFILPDERVPTDTTISTWDEPKYQMKAGYGINADVHASATTTSESSYFRRSVSGWERTSSANKYTDAGYRPFIQAYFPEFYLQPYEHYHGGEVNIDLNRSLEVNEDETTSEETLYFFQHNGYSHWNNRVHFTPVWFPDGTSSNQQYYIVKFDMIGAASPLGITSSGEYCVSYNGVVKGDQRIDFQDGWLAKAPISLMDSVFNDYVVVRDWLDEGNHIG